MSYDLKTKTKKIIPLASLIKLINDFSHNLPTTNARAPIKALKVRVFAQFH